MSSEDYDYDGSPFEEDDTPWADPAIRANYIAALGGFILAFNEVDYYVSQIIGWDYHAEAASTFGMP